MDLIELYEFKLELLKEIEKDLSEKERKEALKDSHSKRRPIGCGFTIHPAYGCTNKCLYCYIQDMGLGFKIKLNKLNGKQILYALLNNNYFVPNIMFLAFGSITDPFHPQVINKTMDYMNNLKILKNPIQFSTKFPITEDVTNRLKEIDKDMSGLITIVSLKRYNALEPNAPAVERRIETIEILRKYIKPAIFLRPIIPGINEDEIKNIIQLAKEMKVPIVFGEFRATKNNLERLKKRFTINETLKRLERFPKNNEQVRLKMNDIIDKAIKISKECKVRYFIRASCHNAWAHKIVNPALEFLKNGCIKCENNCLLNIPKIDEGPIEEFLEYLNIKNFSIEICETIITINGELPNWVKVWIEVFSKRKVLVK